MSCHSSPKTKKDQSGNGITIALAGNANVGKSVIFNNLTGSSQIIGNWPGKTVEKAEGTLTFEGQKIAVIDLPGIYSFSTFGMEELVSREYIATQNPDAVINVVDASVLERNLFFTLQLIEMEAPLLIALNQVDTAKRKGITINAKKLEKALGVPVVPTVGIRGEGIYELTKTALAIAKNGKDNQQSFVRYGAEVEERIGKLQQAIDAEKLDLQYPSRWVAIKLLENDPEIKKLISAKSQAIIKTSNSIASEISSIHNEPCFAVIASERYALASKIANEAQQQQTKTKTTFSEKLEWLTTHKTLGYLTSAGVIAGLLLWTFFVGTSLSDLLSSLTELVQPLDPQLSGPVLAILVNGLWGGFNAGLTLIVPFVIPFYFILAMVEDSGILTRVAFMMDSAMHKIGLHGKALIPVILGYGCNVPAIHSCKIMETRRERLLASFAITFAPCSARTIVLFGMVGLFVGIQWALALYVVDIAVIFVLGRIAMKAVPGKSTGLIMEMHNFKVPSLKVVAKQTWTRTKSIIYVVFPIYMIGSALLQALYALNILTPISSALAPLTVWWLGLPAIAGVLLILGAVRKELILLGAVTIFGTSELILFMSPVQLVTITLVGMLYIPCVSTIAILIKEFGWKAGITITIANIVTAILIGGLTYRLLTLFL
ncbi:MAG: ferrous iron transport protein B [Chloroflexi bacterium]|nr:ferrous iron transport protein B [Chloroflexota bacterium]